MSDAVIQVDNLGKRYRIGQRERYLALRDVITEAVKAPFRALTRRGKNNQNEDAFIWALKDISFEVKRGEVLGIIGKNGAGKSTLLKVLTQITEPTEGHATIHGRVASLLEVGTGFHPELTGRDNIFLNGAILGMSRKEIQRKFDEIVAFSEIEKFIDTPVKRYSSGMYVRLAFAVAAHMEPEIMLVDEVLAVGDAQFQKKCLGKMGAVAKEGRTVLFVSHNMAAIENLCHNAMLLDRGIIKFAGTQAETISEYQKIASTKQGSLRDRTDRMGSGEVRLVSIEARDVKGHTINNVACGQDLDVVFHYEALPGFQRSHVIASFIVKTQWDVPVFLHHNRLTGNEFGVLNSQGAFVCRIRKLPLTPSTYRIGYSIMIGSDYLDSISDAAELNVVAGDFFGSGEIPPSSHGFCLIDAHWSLES